MADKAAGGKPAGASGERPQLHVAHGNALIAARGYGAPETTEAFARARRQVGLGDKAAPERLAADYGLWAGSYVRGELPAMRTHAVICLKTSRRDLNRPRPASLIALPDHALVRGRICRSARALWNARSHCSSPGGTTISRFGSDTTRALRRCFPRVHFVAAGDVGRAVSRVGDADARITDLDHVGTRALTRTYAATIALMLATSLARAMNGVQLASTHARA